MNCQKLPAMFLPPSLLQLWAELDWAHCTWEMGTQNRGRQGQLPPFPSPGTLQGLRLGSLAAGGGAEGGDPGSSRLATEEPWLDSAALSIPCTHFQAAIAMVTWKWCWLRPARALQHRKWHFWGGLCSQGLWVPGMWLL